MADKAAEITATLPSPWSAVWDPQSRHYYYWNEETDEVTWERPGRGRRNPTVSLPPGWREILDEATGKLFYWHTPTNKTQWEPPSTEGSENSEESPAQAPRDKKKRNVIMAESYDTSRESFTPKSVPKSEASKKTIRSALQGSAGFLFSSLSSEELEQVVMAMQEKRLKKGEEIIRQGDKGDNFYVVEDGTFDIDVNGKKVAQRTNGESFGELALLYNCPRAASVIAATDASVWALDRVTFRYMIASTREDQVASIVQSLRNVQLLETLTDEQLHTIADAVQERAFQPGDRIISKGDEGETFYMIKSGEVVCTDIGSSESANDVTLGEGSYFGERALLLAEPRAANVVAKTPVTCMVLDRMAFTELLGPLREILDDNLKMRVVSSISVFSDLSDGEKEHMVKGFREHEVPAGVQVVKEGDINDTFLVVKSGQLKVQSGDKTVRTVEAGGFYGEDTLTRDVTAEHSVYTAEPSVLFSITRRDFEKSQKAAAKSGETSKSKPSAEESEKRDLHSMRLKDLEIMKTLGAGTFGRVKLVKYKPTGEAYALKVLQKAQIVAYGQQKNVMHERDVMAMIDHPFVLKLIATMKDKDCLYMVMELVQGGELFALLANQPTGCLTVESTRFYAACVIAGLEAMHDKNIVYRDLKPENMLIDDKGYIKIVDMGFAKIVKDRTYTLCGTPEYLAPELVLGKGHGKGVDYWAVGVLIYEMLCGVSPFSDESQDQMVICKKIVKGKYSFSGWVKDKDVKDLVKHLLKARVTDRLGCKKGGTQDVKNHKFFKKGNFDWDSLLKKELPAPWVPPLKNPFDSSHFEAYDDEEEIEPYEPDGTNWDAHF